MNAGWKDKSVLILEDEMFIAMDIEETLVNAGYTNIKLLMSCSGAAEWLATHTPDLAIIDPHLNDGTCSEAANILVKRGTPFLVYSGDRTMSEEGGQSFRNGSWLPKPSLPEVLVLALQDL